MTDRIKIIEHQPLRILNLQPKEVLDVRFWPTDICNFDCTYCFPYSKDAVYRYPKNIETVVKNFRLLFDLYKEKYNKTKFDINLVGGGEPTLWPHFNEFCKGMKTTHNVEMTVTTNGSRTLRWWQENVDYIDKVTLSVHHEFADIDHCIQVLDYLYSRNITCTALVLMDAEHFEKCKNIVEKMKTSKYPWFIEAKPVVDYDGKDSLSYTQEQRDYMRMDLKRLPDSDFLLSHMHNLRIHDSIAIYDETTVEAKRTGDYINQGVNYFQDWKCNVGLENLVIQYDGQVKGSCQAQLFENTNINMFSEDFESQFNKVAFALDTITCPFSSCSCQPDTHITKWRS